MVPGARACWSGTGVVGLQHRCFDARPIGIIRGMGARLLHEAREALLYLVESGDEEIAAAAERALEDLEAAEDDPLDA